MSASKQLEIFETDFYKTYTNSLRLIGLWPFDNIYRQKIIRFFILILLITFTILQGIRLYEEFGHDLDVIAELIASITFFTGCIFKYLVTIQSEASFQFLYEQIQSHWDITTNIERQILEKTTNKSQVLTQFYMGAAYSALVIYVSTPVLTPIILDIAIPLNESRERIFPYYIEYFVDTDVYYYRLIAHGTVCFILSVMVYVSIDSMYASCGQHLCSLFDVVEHRLQEAINTHSNIIDLELNNNDKTIRYKLLNKAIVLHQDSLDFAAFIESTYAPGFLPVLGLYFITMVALAVDIIINIHGGNLALFIRFVILYIVFSFHIFFNCNPGQKVNDKSVSVMNSVYFSEWYNLPLDARRLIQIIIHRSSIPCQFTAGNIVVLNMENFIALMKTSMSYMTVVSSIK